MSIRLSTGDSLSFAGTTGVTTGAFSVGMGVKIVTDTNTWADIVGLFADATGGASYMAVATDSDGLAITITQSFGGTDPINPSFSLVVDTWYWVVMSRSAGGVVTIRIFADSSSTTPVDSANTTTGTDDISALDNFRIGLTFSGESLDAEVRVVKFVTDVEWTDTQAIAEAADGTQVFVGTPFLSCTLKDLATGLEDLESTHDLTNSGAVDGASNPSYIGASEAAAGGDLLLKMIAYLGG